MSVRQTPKRRGAQPRSFHHEALDCPPVLNEQQLEPHAVIIYRYPQGASNKCIFEAYEVEYILHLCGALRCFVSDRLDEIVQIS